MVVHGVTITIVEIKYSGIIAYRIAAPSERLPRSTPAFSP